jgi:NitT/TauT family transport system permease protein
VFSFPVREHRGRRHIEKIYRDVAKNYGASQTVMFTRIVFFLARCRRCSRASASRLGPFIVLVAAEFVATKSGLGYLIWNSWEPYRSTSCSAAS